MRRVVLGAMLDEQADFTQVRDRLRLLIDGCLARAERLSSQALPTPARQIGVLYPSVARWPARSWIGRHMMATLTLNLPMEEITALCREYHVQELSIFGSALRDDFREDSDLDLLVLFDPDAGTGFLELAALQRKLAEVIGRPVDLVSKRGLKPAIRQDVLDSSMIIYGQE